MELQTNGARVLVVDDERLKRMSLAADFEAAGYAVTARASADEARADIGNGGFDVVITDFRMPGMDGLTFLRKVKLLHPDTAVIVITGRRSAAVVDRARRAGAHDCIAKPFSNEKLVDRVDGILASDRRRGELLLVPGDRNGGPFRSTAHRARRGSGARDG